MTGDIQLQQTLDEEHLRLLSLFYFISAGLSAFFSLFPALYMGIGIVVVASSSTLQTHGSNPPPAGFGWILFGIGAILTLLFLLFAALKFVAGRSIKRRRHRPFCMVIAGLSCIAIPYGTLLGIFSFIVLGRLSVKTLFDAQRAQSGEK